MPLGARGLRCEGGIAVVAYSDAVFRTIVRVADDGTPMLRRAGVAFILQVTGDLAILRRVLPDVERMGPREQQRLLEILTRVLEDDLFGGRLRSWRENIEIAPLFRAGRKAGDADDRFALWRFLRFRFRGIAFVDLAAEGIHAYDLAYAMRDAANRRLGADVLRRVCPDEIFTLSLSCYPDPPPPPPAVGLDWAIQRIGAPQAWAMPRDPALAYELPIRVGHPDTGYTVHPEFDPPRVIESDGTNIADGTADPSDPLVTTLTNRHPAHGTSTGALIMSGGPDQNPPGAADVIAGVAPNAHLIPIRCVDHTAFIANGAVAAGLDYATRQNCDVVSISLGGQWTPGFEAALNEAVYGRSMVVVAAAGQCIGSVVNPAAYDDCIAVAGSGQADQPWQHSSRGAEVDICAPAEDVRLAEVRRANGIVTYSVGIGSGTSFATAYVGGVAALWLHHHGRAAIRNAAAARGLTVQHLFRDIAQRTALVPNPWPAGYGPGIIQADRVLAEPLIPPVPGPGPAAPAPVPPPPDPEPDFLFMLSRMFALTPQAAAANRKILAERARALFRTADPAALERLVDQFGPEMVNSLIIHGDVAAREFGLTGPRREVPPVERLRDFLGRFGSRALRVAVGLDDRAPEPWP